MKLEEIYESFFDTYRSMGYMISELSQRLLRRASAVATGAAEGPQVKYPDAKDNLARDLNIEKLKTQSARFKDAADKKAKKSADAATKADGRKGGPRRRRADIVNKSLKDTEGFANDMDRNIAINKASSRTRGLGTERLRKRFKGELDG